MAWQSLVFQSKEVWLLHKDGWEGEHLSQMFHTGSTGEYFRRLGKWKYFEKRQPEHFHLHWCDT